MNIKISRRLLVPGGARKSGMARKGRSRKDPPALAPISLIVMITTYMTLTQGTFNLFLLNSFLLAGVGAMALNLAMGQAGLISVATSGFLGAGSLTAVLMSRAGWNPVVALGAAAIVGGVLGVLFALPSARLDSLYFSLSTLAAQAILIHFLTQHQRDDVGEAGYIRLPLFSSHGLLGIQRTWAWLLCGVLSAVTLVCAAMRKGRVGRTLRQVRDHELAAAASGVYTRRWRVLVMLISSALISLQGGLTYFFSGTSSMASFTFLISVQYLAMVLIGGADTLMGPLFGAAVIVLLPKFTRDAVEAILGADVALRDGARISQILYGVFVVVAIVGPPRGLDGAARWVVESPGAVVRRLRGKPACPSDGPDSLTTN